MHLCMHAWMHAWMHGCIQASMHEAVHLCMHASLHPCMYASIDASMHAFMHPCMHPCIHASMHASMHPCIHAFMHASTPRLLLIVPGTFLIRGRLPVRLLGAGGHARYISPVQIIRGRFVKLERRRKWNISECLLHCACAPFIHESLMRIYQNVFRDH